MEEKEVENEDRVEVHVLCKENKEGQRHHNTMYPCNHKTPKTKPNIIYMQILYMYYGIV